MTAPEGASTIWEEFCPTEFSRQIGLPVDVDPAKIEATYTNGVLLVTAPKAEHAKRARLKSRCKLGSFGRSELHATRNRMVTPVSTSVPGQGVPSRRPFFVWARPARCARRPRAAL